MKVQFTSISATEDDLFKIHLIAWSTQLSEQNTNRKRKRAQRPGASFTQVTIDFVVRKVLFFYGRSLPFSAMNLIEAPQGRLNWASFTFVKRERKKQRMFCSCSCYFPVGPFSRKQPQAQTAPQNIRLDLYLINFLQTTKCISMTLSATEQRNSNDSPFGKNTFSTSITTFDQ